MTMLANGSSTTIARPHRRPWLVPLLAATLALASACKSREPHGSETLASGKRESMLEFLQRSVPNGDAKFYDQITVFAAAFHQPILLDPSITDLLAPTNPEREQFIDFLIIDKLRTPTYACHEMAHDLRDVIGKGTETVAGGFGQANRKAAIAAAVETLNGGVPAVITLRNTSRSDDGHSFSLVLNEDGIVDTLEGWASNSPTDISTGKKNNLSRKKVIDALHKIELDPTDPKNDTQRGEGYDYISQAYGKAAIHYHEQSRERSIKLYKIPENADGAQTVDIPALGFKKVYFNTQTRKFTGERGDRIPFTLPNFTEREDSEIEISAKIRQLDDRESIKNKLAARLSTQELVLKTYVSSR